MRTRKALIAKLVAAGINRDHILDVPNTKEVEVGVMNAAEQRCEYEESEAVAERVMEILGWRHAIKTGYNSWVIEGHDRGDHARYVNEMDQFGIAERDRA